MSTVAEGNSRYRMLLVPTYSMCDEACVQSAVPRDSCPSQLSV